MLLRICFAYTLLCICFCVVPLTAGSVQIGEGSTTGYINPIFTITRDFHNIICLRFVGLHCVCLRCVCLCCVCLRCICLSFVCLVYAYAVYAYAEYADAVYAYTVYAYTVYAYTSAYIVQNCK